MTKIELENGKYTVIHDNGCNFHALRYGEQWRDLTGDGLVLAMTQRIEDLEDHIRKTDYELDKLSEAQNRYMKAEAESERLRQIIADIDDMMPITSPRENGNLRKLLGMVDKP